MSLYRCVQLYLVQIPYDPMSDYMYKYVCVYLYLYQYSYPCLVSSRALGIENLNVYKYMCAQMYLVPIPYASQSVRYMCTCDWISVDICMCICTCFMFFSCM